LSIMDASLTLPNLLIIGAQKCGTTWLHNRLSQHPDILMSAEKELNFFARVEKTKTIDEYSSNFEAGRERLYRGESTPAYFWTYDKLSKYCEINPAISNTRIPESVVETLGKDVKLIVILRNPVHRAVSGCLHHFRRGRIVPGANFIEAGRHRGIIDMGFYRRHLERWEQAVGFDKILTLFFDDIRANPASVLSSVFRYLDLPEREIPDADNVDHVGLALAIENGDLTIDVSDKYSQNWVKKRESSGLKRPRIKPNELIELHQIYRSDIQYILDRYDRLDLPWSETPRPEDFVAATQQAISARVMALPQRPQGPKPQKVARRLSLRGL